MTRTKEYVAFIKFLFATLAFAYIYIYVFGNPRVSYDGWQYLSSAKAIITNTLPENYFWVRQPGYPLFIALASLLSSSLWFLFGAQTFIFISAYTIFAFEARQYFPSVLLVRYLLLAFGNFAFILFFIGGYFIIVTPQSITSSFLLLLTAGILRTYKTIDIGQATEIGYRKRSSVILLYIFFPFMSLVGYSILAFLGALPIVSLILLLAKHFYTSIRESHESIGVFAVRESKWLGLIFVTVILYVLSSTLWQIYSSRMMSDPGFNVANLKDPFWGSGLNSYIKNMLHDPTLFHYIPATFLALIMFIPNQGWNGATLERSINNHSQNGDVGYGLFSANYGPCVVDPPQVLAVDNDFIHDFLWRNTCSFTHFNLPILAYPLLFLIWITLCGVWIWITLRRKFEFSLIASLPILLFLAVYSLFGGGIDRYGSSSYPIIGFISTIYLYEFFSAHISDRKEVHIKFKK